MVSDFQTMLKEFNDGTYDLTCDGKCTGCGECCSNVLSLTTKEIKEIKRYVAKHHIQQVKHTNVIATKALDMTCPFLDISKSKDKCLIYPVRPKICRDFICDPKQRKTPDATAIKSMKPYVMSEVFFGDTEFTQTLLGVLNG